MTQHYDQREDLLAANPNAFDRVRRGGAPAVQELTGAQTDTLIALVERGPLEDGDVPSKRGRNDLIESGLAVRVMVCGEDGYTAATYAGRELYLGMFGCATVSESILKRLRAHQEAAIARHKHQGATA